MNEFFYTVYIDMGVTMCLNGVNIVYQGELEAEINRTTPQGLIPGVSGFLICIYNTLTRIHRQAEYW